MRSKIVEWSIIHSGDAKGVVIIIGEGGGKWGKEGLKTF
jgi:hypothetical protein